MSTSAAFIEQVPSFSHATILSTLSIRLTADGTFNGIINGQRHTGQM